MKTIDAVVIDIGSNSVRLMTLADGFPLYKALATTRLGEGLAHSDYLKAEAIERTARAVETFVSSAKEKGAKKIFAYATAAVRFAKNGKDFCLRVKELSGVNVEVLSGEEEARLGVLGALGESDGALVDLGGASTEIAVQKSGQVVYEKSVNIGVVRLFDLCGREKERLEKTARDAVELFGNPPCESLVAIGGTATTLAARERKLTAYDPVAVTGVKISRDRMRALAEELLALPVSEIENEVIPKKRAEVLGGGAMLLAVLMERFSIPELTVLDGDNLEGFAKSRGLMK